MKVRKVEAVSKFKKLRVAAYCRVSTTRVVQEDSLESQQRTYTSYIRSNPEWEFAGIYSDTQSGLSADKRPGFLQLIEDCKAGKIDLILCKSISRFSRNIVECQRYTDLLRSKNIAVVFEKEKLRTDAPTSNLIFSLMCAIAQDESRSISENIQASNRKRVEAGIYTPQKNRMLGYGVKDGKYVPNQDAWIITHIFTRYAEGAGLVEICGELDKKGATRMLSKREFTPSVLQSILKNESYVGDKQLQKQAPWNYLTKRPDDTVEYVSNYLTDDHEPIICREIWNKVQERMENERNARQEGINPRHTAHPLYGRLFCGECGQPYIRRTFTGRTADENGNKHYKVWCCKGRTHSSGCKNPNVKEAELLNQIEVLGNCEEKLLIGLFGEVNAGEVTQSEVTRVEAEQ